MNGFYQCLHPVFWVINQKGSKYTTFEMNTNSVFAVLSSSTQTNGKQIVLKLTIFHNGKIASISCHKNYFDHRCRAI